VTSIAWIVRVGLVVCFAACVTAAEARETIVEDAPVPGGIAGLAKSLGIDPPPDRARFMHEITRVVYDTSEVRAPAVAAFLAAVRQPPRGRPSPLGPTSASDVVPVPLTADLWGDAIFQRRVSRDELVAAIISDRQAALICHGLLRLDDETLSYFAEHRGLLVRIYERSAPVFAAFAGSFRIRDGRLVPAGDADATPMWETIIGEKMTRPDRFLQTLLETSDGRLAFLYDTIANVDPPHRAFVLGLWLPAAQQADRFRELAAGLNAMREWHVRVMPFGRPSFDFAMTLTRIAVGDDGTPLPPAGRGFWARLFNLSDPGDEAPFDAAWLAANVTATDVRQRGERVDQVTFGQRVFSRRANDAERTDVEFVLRMLPRFRALVLSFERAGIRSPAVYAAAIRHAGRLTSMEGRRAYVAQSQFQGVLVLLTRMMMAGTFDVATGERLITRLTAATMTDAGYAGSISRWIREELYPALPAARDVESAIIAGLGGRSPDAASMPRVTWEGQRYRLDLAASERNRLQRVREKQRALAIDLPLQMADAARTVAAESASADDLQDAATQFTALAADLPQRSREEDADSVPPGVNVPPPSSEPLKKAADDLTRAARSRDLKRAGRIVEPIVELADDLLARNLLSFAYAISLGDPEGTVLLADDVSHRHDYGLGLKDGELRARLTWAVPRQEVAPGVPWHISGSLMGLDVAMSTLTLRRVATDRVLEAPKLTSNARDTFAASVALMNPLALRDADRDAIAAAIGRGQRRVAAADAAALDLLAEEALVEPARRRALKWTLQHDRASLADMFSLTELLALGGGRVADLQPWGMAVVSANGCFCSRLLPPAAWRVLSGRPQLGLLTAIMPDVNFRVAMVLSELNLPAPLARVVLSAAVQDFIDEVRPTDDGDWLSLSRTARSISRERIEDYVAAATAAGPLIPDVARSPEFVR
jgi:hypothetical protein